MKTPQQSHAALAEALGLSALYVKREDLHSYGSHKGRSIPLMMKQYAKQQGTRAFAISSSGNAAYAAAMTADRYNLSHADDPMDLTIFVGEKIDAQKLRRLQRFVSQHIRITQVPRPKQAAFKFEKEGQGKNIRQSTDDTALSGYESLAKELTKIPDLKHIVMPVSSGTAAQAVGMYLVDNGLPIALHIVQTTACHPIATALGATTDSDEPSTAKAIVDNVAHRKDVIVHAVTETNGTATIATNTDIEQGQALLKQQADIDATPNGALSVAGLVQKHTNQKQLTGAVAVIVCGI